MTYSWWMHQKNLAAKACRVTLMQENRGEFYRWVGQWLDYQVYGFCLPWERAPWEDALDMARGFCKNYLPWTSGFARTGPP